MDFYFLDYEELPPLRSIARIIGIPTTKTRMQTEIGISLIQLLFSK
jgi:hypothetical protein